MIKTLILVIIVVIIVGSLRTSGISSMHEKHSDKDDELYGEDENSL